MKEFCIYADVVFTGNFYIEAETEEEAIKKLKERSIVPSDLRSGLFCNTGLEVVDVEEAEWNQH